MRVESEGVREVISIRGVQELITSGVGHKVACVDIEGSWDSGGFGDRDIMPRGPL